MGEVIVSVDEEGEGGRVGGLGPTGDGGKVGGLGTTGGGGGIEVSEGVAPVVTVIGERETERWEMGG